VDKELKALIKPLGMQLETMLGINTVTASAFIAEIGIFIVSFILTNSQDTQV
jgi:hypothetical protein